MRNPRPLTFALRTKSPLLNHASSPLDAFLAMQVGGTESRWLSRPVLSSCSSFLNTSLLPMSLMLSKKVSLSVQTSAQTIQLFLTARLTGPVHTIQFGVAQDSHMRFCGIIFQYARDAETFFQVCSLIL